MLIRAAVLLAVLAAPAQARPPLTTDEEVCTIAMPRIVANLMESWDRDLPLDAATERVAQVRFGDLTPAARAQAKAMAIAMPRSFYNVGILEYASDRATITQWYVDGCMDSVIYGTRYHGE